MKPILYVIVILSLGSCFLNAPSAKYLNEHSNETFEDVSLDSLRSNPDKYDNKKIRLTGIYRLGQEKSAIYPPGNFKENGNAVWVNFSWDFPLFNTTTGEELFQNDKEEDKIANKCLRIKGTFNSKANGHLDKYLGEMDDVVSIEVFN